MFFVRNLKNLYLSLIMFKGMAFENWSNVEQKDELKMIETTPLSAEEREKSDAEAQLKSVEASWKKLHEMIAEDVADYTPPLDPEIQKLINEKPWEAAKNPAVPEELKPTLERVEFYDSRTREAEGVLAKYWIKLIEDKNKWTDTNKSNADSITASGAATQNVDSANWTEIANQNADSITASGAVQSEDNMPSADSVRAEWSAATESVASVSAEQWSVDSWEIRSWVESSGDSNLEKETTPKALNFSQDSNWNLVLPDDFKKEVLEGWKWSKFKFSLDWVQKDKMWDNPDYWSFLPTEIWVIEVWWKKYERMWIDGQFLNPETKETLVIKEGDAITIDSLRTESEVKEKEAVAAKKANEYLSTHPEIQWEDQREVVQEWFRLWSETEEINKILSGDFSILKNLVKGTIFEWLIDTLNNKWLLDNFNRWTWTAENVSINAEWLPEWTEVSADMQEVVKVASAQIGIHENTWQANKFLNWRNARKIPWCAWFVNWCLQQTGHSWTWSDLAKSFINWSWFGHVWFKIWDKILWWNQSNKVSLMPINKPIVWRSLPKKGWGFEIHKPAWDVSKIPEGAIIVFDRWKSKSDKKYA